MNLHYDSTRDRVTIDGREYAPQQPAGEPDPGEGLDAEQIAWAKCCKRALDEGFRRDEVAPDYRDPDIRTDWGRAIEVSEDREEWVPRIFIGYCETLERPWVVLGSNELSAIEFRYARIRRGGEPRRVWVNEYDLREWPTDWLWHATKESADRSALRHRIACREFIELPAEQEDRS